uniref:Uncharacterized protein n=1 Tax=Parascaris equorum TaxID=6256 RepID=A0A914RDD1_PAREQ
MLITFIVETWDFEIHLCLVSLYELKPPISKKKIVDITKAAMKAIKFYKHIVFCVEKFLTKVCVSFVATICLTLLLDLDSQLWMSRKCMKR